MDDYLTEDEAREALRQLYETTADGYGHPSWVRVEELTGVNRTTACRIATTDYFPKSPHIRKLLGVPAVRDAPVCPTCNVVHVKKCPKDKIKHRDWFAYDVEELRSLIENRREVTNG